jgi:hypothetical protein
MKNVFNLAREEEVVAESPNLMPSPRVFVFH